MISDAVKTAVIGLSLFLSLNCATPAVKQSEISTPVAPVEKEEPELPMAFQWVILAGLRGEPDAPRYLLTEKIGVVDLAHVRAFLNLTDELQHVVTRKLSQAKSSGGRAFYVRLRSPHAAGLTAVSDIKVDLEERPDPPAVDLVRDLAMTHGYLVELRQGDVFPPMFLSGSSFSQEDLQSNRLGIEIALLSSLTGLDAGRAALTIFTDLRPVSMPATKPASQERSYSYLPYVNGGTQDLPQCFQYSPVMVSDQSRILGIRTIRSAWEWQSRPAPLAQ